MPYTAWPHTGCCSDPSPLIKAGAQLSAGHRCCPLLSPASCPRHAPRAPLDYEAPAGCLVGCFLLVLVPLDLGKHLSVVSVSTSSSRSPTARLGDKCSRVRRIERVRPHADLTMLARLATALAEAGAVPLAA